MQKIGPSGQRGFLHAIEDAVILKSGDVTLTAFQDSPLLLVEEGAEKRWLWSRRLETPYGILRL